MFKSLFGSVFFSLLCISGYAQIITTGTITGSPFCAGASVNVPFTFTGGTFTAGNVFTAQLSSASGSFATPTAIGTLSGTSAGTIVATIPANQPAGSAYLIQVVGSSPVGTPVPSAPITIKALGISAPTFAGTSFCQGAPFTANYTVTGSCNFPNTPSNNIFTAQISDATGSFATPTNIGSITSNTSGAITATIPVTVPGGTTYRIRVVSSNPGTGVASPDNGTDITVKAIGITGPTFSGTYCSGISATFSYTFASGCSFIAPNTFTAQISDASGSFASPTNIGSVLATTAGSISVAIPNTTPFGTHYRFRMVSSNPALISNDNGTDLTFTALGIAAPTITGTSFCSGAAFNITNNLSNACPFTSVNHFTAQLSDAAGSFASPTTIGTSTSTTGGTIAVTLPTVATTGTAYRIRVISDNPVITGPANASSLTITALGINTPTFTGTSFCGGASISIAYSLAGACAFQSGNIFRAELSDATGSFGAPTVIGSVTSTAAGTITGVIPTSITTGTMYRIRVTGTNPSTASPDNGTNLSLTPVSLSAPSFAGTVFCDGNSFPVTYSAGCTFQSGNIFTAELSDAAGSFATPTTIGTLTSVTSGMISVTIPTSVATGTGYRIRIGASNPVLAGADNGADLSITALSLQAPTFTGTSFCQGAAVTINYMVTSACAVPDVPSPNVFTAQLSNSSGSFAAPTTIGTVTANSSGSIAASIPISTPAGLGYRIRVVSSNPGTGLVSPDNGGNIVIKTLALASPIPAITSFCQSQTFNVTYTVSSGCSLPDTPSLNVFTAELSDASGSFASPTAIGSVTASTSGTLSVTIPAAQPAGTAYRIRVVSSNPGAGLTSPQNSAALTVNVLKINAPTFAGTSFCQNASLVVNYVVPSSCGFPNTPSNNIFSAQLSDASGSFASPVVIGTATSSVSGTINTVIPLTSPAGTGYRIRVVSSNPGSGDVSPDNGTNLTINAIGLNTPTFTGTTFCQGQTFTLNYTFPMAACGFVTGNVFTAQLSDQFGNFSAPQAIGTVTQTTAGSISVTIPTSQIPGNAYRIRVAGSNPAVISPDNGANLSINSLGINAPVFTPTTFCQGASFALTYTIQNACGFPNTPSSNVFTAQLSDASGSFASPIVIGSTTTTGSGTINVTIPTAQTPGTGYRIRLVSSNPGAGLISADNGTNLNISATSGNPATFGNGFWNAYVYNAASLTNYTGFYTENNLSFNTTTRFNSASPPSTADGSSGAAYVGCADNAAPWTISYKRTNFACGYYQIDIPSHDDNVTIFVNGTQVYTLGYDGLSHTNVWSGFLGALNTVEIQIVNTGGPGNLTANFSTSATPITTSPPVTICSTASTVLTASSALPLSFQWSPTTGLTPSTGVGSSVTAMPATTTTYSVVGTDATSGCSTPPSSVLVTVSSTFTPIITNVSPTICSGISTTTLTASGANSYTWTPTTGLSSPSGNVVTANPAVTTVYTVHASNGCTTNTASTTVTVLTIPSTPSPATFGNNTWNVYGFNDQTFTQFYGYYTENNLSFNTNSRWNANIGPWNANAASGMAWSGCAGGPTNWSASFKRTNFTCGYYQIDIPYHDDNITLYINGAQIFQHNGCCDNHTNVYTGFLGPNTDVELRLINGAGPGSLQVTIAPSATSPLTVNPSVVICSGQTAVLNSSTTVPGVTYSWTNSAGTTALIAAPTAANTTAGPLTASDIYTVTITDAANTITCTSSASVPVTVNPTPLTTVTPTSGSSYCPGTPYTLTASGANTYSWSPTTGLNVSDQYQVIASPTVTTTYTVTGTNGCGSLDATATITVNPVASVSTFPTGKWNVYGFNTTTVGSGYQGYYTENGSGTSGYDFDTGTRWASGAPPSNANATNGQAWLGCVMPAVNISLSFKRTGFMCGLYQVNVNNHDDGFILFINGVQVAQHNGCCDSHVGIWSGLLNATSTVEWQLVQGGGGSGLGVTFVPQTLPAGSSIWVGSASNDWFNASNWCSTVPTSTTDAVVPAGTVNFPTIAAAGANVRSITISAPVVAGTYTNALPGAALTTAASNNLNVFGNWTNGGTFTANTGTITFTGTNSGNTINNTFPTTFYNFVLNKTNGLTNTGGLMYVSNSLALTNGVFTDNAAINVLNGATVTGASNSSYIDGPITKTGNLAFSFPVGKGGLLRPIAISAPALATDNFTAQYFNSNPNPSYPNAQRAATIDHISGAEYWYLNRSGGSDNVFVTLSWNTNSGGVGNPATLRVARWDVTLAKWIDEGNSATTGTTTAGTVTSLAAVTTFSSPNSPFSLGSTNLQNTLPVELTDFSCQLTAPGVVKINWTTQSEVNNDHFDIERSRDGKSFDKIMSVVGNGTTNEAHRYSETDLAAPSGVIHYRLRQVDYNGVSTLSEVETIDNPYSNAVSLYPNPAGDSFSIDLNGRTVNAFVMIDLVEKEMSVPYTTTSEKITVVTSSLASGVYIVQIVLDGQVHRLKMIRR